MINIALLGFGTVGSGVAEVIATNNDKIKNTLGEDINIKYILDLRDFPDHPLANRVIHNFDIIEKDSDVQIVAEMMGGCSYAYDYTMRALKSGKSVVTSNKEVVAKYGHELLNEATKHNVLYMFEASVGGGIPVIKPIQNYLDCDKILKIEGILNGTTNYILTKMSNGYSYEEALIDAQKMGYAEANPSADVDGFDARRKICILSALCFGKWIDEESIPTQGITGITLEDIKKAQEHDQKIKLTGRAEIKDNKITVSVAPRIVSKDNPLYGIDDVYNGIMLDCQTNGTIMFFGPGAGKLPTASAVLSDIAYIIKKAGLTNEKI